MTRSLITSVSFMHRRELVTGKSLPSDAELVDWSPPEEGGEGEATNRGPTNIPFFWARALSNQVRCLGIRAGANLSSTAPASRREEK